MEVIPKTGIYRPDLERGAGGRGSPDEFRADLNVPRAA